MANHRLREALEAFVEEAAERLGEATAAGEEIPFEVVEEGGRGRPLYCYRPLTGRFIHEHAAVLRVLPRHAQARAELATLGGLDAYLEARGVRPVPADARARADAVLEALLTDVFDEATEFEPRPERFGRAYGELERVLVDGRAAAAVLAPVLGLAIASPEVPLGDGLTLLRGDALEGAPPEAAWPDGSGERPAVLAVISIGDGVGSEEAAAHARVRLMRLLAALRLFEHGGVALGASMWARAAGGPWRLVTDGGALGSGRAYGPVVAVPPAQEDELRAFCSLIARRTPRAGELAWALARYGMGCDRATAAEALTDHLLGLRALLEPEGPASGRLAGRLAAICALPAERGALAERVAHAVALERALVAGIAPLESGVEALVDELAAHLRALLRDVLCGHLDSDLRALADRLLDGEVAEAAAAAPA
jgi:hypothetical protein